MIRAVFSALLLCLLIATGSSRAAFNQDPLWPCVQRKVEEISLGQMWPIPLESRLDLDAGDRRLVEILGLRRLTEEELAGYIAEYAATDPGADRLGSVFAAVLDDINYRRSRIIAGIGRYSEGQQNLAREIDRMRHAIDEASTAASPDFDAIDLMEKDLDWSVRIHKDRERSLLYVCETPVLLEKHAFSVAKLLLPHAQE